MSWTERLGWTACMIVSGVSLLWAASKGETESLTRPSVSQDADAVSRGAAAFQGAGFGGISTDALATNAVPWRIVAAALVLEEQASNPSAALDLKTLDDVLARFGFLTNPVVVDRQASVIATRSSMPLGFTVGDLAPVGGSHVRVANLGCAACHAGVTYRADGTPKPGRAKLGMPNSSLDLEAYTTAIFLALRKHSGSDRLLPAVDTLFPDLSWQERQSLRFVVLPLVKQRLASLRDTDRPLPFPNGAPGSTNGVAALKASLGLPLLGGGAGDAGVVSIPDLGDRVWKTSLLVDGAYAPPGTDRRATTHPSSITPAHLRRLAAITTFFTVPSMGVHPDKALSSLDDASDVMAFLAAYRPQPFPGAIDLAAARQGAGVYASSCAGCHGNYSDSPSPRLTSYPNWIGDVGTDQLRAQAFDAALAEAVNRTAYRATIAARRGSGYIAPPLTGLWASAPYLHNGSVPTLAALLSPDQRPRRFQVGGHALDFARVGLRLDHGRYPPGYRPFSRPTWIDTASLGRDNRGHRYGEALSAADKQALIEYLKQL